jgi:orotidine-5'-phosphate decarboxylase
MMNVHAGGSNMMQMVTDYVTEEAEKGKIRKPLLLAITVLTSMSDDDLKKDLLLNLTVSDYVEHLALMTKKSGFNGVVCSPIEIQNIKHKCGKDFLAITPGIRPEWLLKKDDQKRVTTPLEAIKNGADFIVVGRPIIKAENPEKPLKNC